MSLPKIGHIFPQNHGQWGLSQDTSSPVWLGAIYLVESAAFQDPPELWIVQDWLPKDLWMSNVDGFFSNSKLTTFILLMAEILHQLRLVVYPIIYRVSAPSQVVQDFSHQQYHPVGMILIKIVLSLWEATSSFIVPCCSAFCLIKWSSVTCQTWNRPN